MTHTRYEFDAGDIPCPTHATDPDCWCAARVAMLESLALATEADAALAGYVDTLDPTDVRIQELHTIGPISRHVLDAMLGAVRARFASARLIADAFGQADLPAGIDPPGRPSSGCAHLDADPSRFGFWHANAAGMWRCADQCAASITRPDRCDGCHAELDDGNRHPTVVAHPSSYRPPSALWPALLVVISLCQRCNDDDLDRLDDRTTG